MWSKVCVKELCVMEAQAEAGGADGSSRTRTRTPQKDVGNNSDTNMGCSFDEKGVYNENCPGFIPIDVFFFWPHMFLVSENV